MPVASVFPLLRVAMLGFAINLVTGLAFITFDPATYYFNPAFRLKMAAVALAGLNALVFAVALVSSLRTRRMIFASSESLG